MLVCKHSSPRGVKACRLVPVGYHRHVAGPSRQATNRRVIYETLRRKMLTLELPPGAALSENELAASLGVSRTPVRESLILLAEEGLVQIFPQVGTFVSRVDPQKVAEAQFLREAIELAALEDLPPQPDPDLVQELKENLEHQQVRGINLEHFFGLDEAFHHGVLRLSGHGSAWSTVVSAKGHLDRARRLGLFDAKTPEKFAKQHADIFQAILDNDIPLSRERMRKHLRTVFEDVERIRARSPDLFASNSESVPIRRNVVVWE
jgi:GntR family transcriptional regulator, rspAB operon transcriptional repressor